MTDLTDDDMTALPTKLRKLAPPDLPDVEEAMLVAAAALEQLWAEVRRLDKTIYLDALNYAHLRDRADAAEAERDKWRNLYYRVLEQI